MLSEQTQVLAFGDSFALLTVTCLRAAAISRLAKPGPAAIVATPSIEETH